MTEPATGQKVRRALRQALRTAWLNGGHGSEADFDAIPPAE